MKRQKKQLLLNFGIYGRFASFFSFLQNFWMFKKFLIPNALKNNKITAHLFRLWNQMNNNTFRIDILWKNWSWKFFWDFVTFKHEYLIFMVLNFWRSKKCSEKLNKGDFFWKISETFEHAYLMSWWSNFCWDFVMPKSLWKDGKFLWCRKHFWVASFPNRQIECFNRN